MEQSLHEQAKAYKTEYSKKKRWRKIVTVLSVAVALCTFYALSEPATTMQQQVYCGFEEHSEHTADCYDEAGELICGMEEHKHSLQCYSDPDADVESSDILERSVMNVPLTGDIAHDAAEIAKTQLGYAESEANYLTAEDGSINGYTRYGDWYGDKYAAWDALFVQFCYCYAGVTEDELPRLPDSESLRSWLSEAGKFMDTDYIPKIGDMAFFKTDTRICSVGIITEVKLGEAGELLGIVTADGDYNNCVQQNERSADDVRILGYGVLSILEPEVEETTEPTPEPAPRPMLKAAALGATQGTKVTSYSTIYNAGTGTRTFYLANDISVTNTITIGTNKNFTIDLNGHKITGTADPLFNINGGTLTIVDNVTENVSVETVKTNGTEYGKTASYSNNKLTYYITETEVINSSTGATSETQKKYTVNSAGMIVGSNNGRRAFTVNGGTLNLNGGYICNFMNNDAGGAVNISRGTVNINGAVLAANTASNRGGAINISGSSAVLNIKSGAIAGNTAQIDGGGGVCAASSAVINMSGGYVTNNYASGADYFQGGGGVLLQSSAQFNQSGGYVTSNKAAGGGGGIKTYQNWDGSNTGKVTMSGGFVTANNCLNAEGGGMNINAGGALRITAGYITNNIAGGGVNDGSFQHWGGGGIFCAENTASSVIQNALITENGAGGFGGGVAGCATGRIISYNDGKASAIFDNYALGEHTSGSESTKNADHHFAKENEVFMSHGYQDYFCALASDVTNGMLGGGLEQWEGSSDGVPVSANSADDKILGGYVTGLTSHASDADKAKAKAAGVAKTFINGNESPTHGGGILVNGYMIMGDDTGKSIDVYCRLEINSIRKQFVDENGLPIEQEPGQFNFTVVDEDGVEVSHGSNTADGEILFDRMLPFTETGSSSSKTFTYYMYELPAEDGSIQNDTAKYKIEVTVSKTANAGTVPWTNVSITKYQFTNLKITETTSGTEIRNGDPGNDESHPIAFDATGGKAFTNRKITGGTPDEPSSTTPKAYVSVTKTYSDNPRTKPSVTVDLLKDGTVVDTRTLSSSNSFKYTWQDLDPTASYTVKERAVANYTPSYDYKYSYDMTTVEDRSQTNEAKLYVKSGSYFVPATSTEKPTASDTAGSNVYIIASSDGTKLLRISAGHADGALSAADVYQTTRDGSNDRFLASSVPADCQFRVIKHTKDNYTYYCFANQGVNSFLLVQEAGGTYLKGTNSTDWASYITIRNGKLMGQREWANNEWRYIIWDGAKFNTDTAVSYVTYEVMSASHKDYTITNTPTASISYKLNIKKVDSESNTVLPGASFQLKNGSTTLKFKLGTNGRYTYTTSSSGSTTSLVTGTDGYIRISGLPAGTYTLKETVPPSGYDLAPDQTVTLNADTPNATLNVTVEDGAVSYILPETGGGFGLIFTYLAGMMLTTGALIPFVRLYRKKR